MEVVTVKGSSVTIYSSPNIKNGREYQGYTLAYTESGVRKRKFTSDLEKAEKLARDIARQLSDGVGHMRSLTPQEVADFISAKNVLRSHPSLTLTEALSEYVRAVEALGSKTIVAACEAQKKTTASQSGFNHATVKQVYEDFIKQLETNDASRRYLEDCRSRMKRIARAFGGYIHNVTSKDLAEWINGLKVGVRTRSNFRFAAVTLWKFAKERGHLPRNLETEAELVPVFSRLKSGRRTAEIGVYKPEEFTKILKGAPDYLLASFAIGGLAGLRSAEVHRLLWSDIFENHIVVKANNAKTGSRRIVPLIPALKFWLGKVKRGDSKERICARFSQENGMARAQTLSIVRSGVTPVHNGLRHSFCTYRLAEVQDAAKVALEAGNSPQMLFKHYRALTTADRAKDWFNIGIEQRMRPQRKRRTRRPKK